MHVFEGGMGIQYKLPGSLKELTWASGLALNGGGWNVVVSPGPTT